MNVNRSVFSVETPTIPLLKEEPVQSTARQTLKRRGDRSFHKIKVDFKNSVVDLKTGETQPLRSSEGKQDFVRRYNRKGMEAPWKYNSPIGHRLLEHYSHGGKGLSLRANRFLVLALTFLCYTAYHASRKPPSIVKSVLHGEQGAMGTTEIQGGHRRSLLEAVGESLLADMDQNKHHHKDNTTLGWEPFNNPKTGKALLGDLDLAFLGSYAIGMFVSGHLGDRLDLRKFLTGGMLGSGACVALFGFAYFAGIHSMGYFLTVQVIGGLLQATGWPSVVTVMANWFGKGKRGLIMGVWNAHTSVGNILGSLIAASMLQFGWGWSFIVPGIFIAGSGVLIFLFLVVEPQDIGFMPQSGSVIGSYAASQAATPQDTGNELSSEDKSLLERRLARMAEEHNGMLPQSFSANMEAHHHIRPPHGQHGMMAMGSTLVLVNDDRDSIDGSSSERDLLLGESPRPTEREKGGVSFFAAWCLPGVSVYAFTLFFAKLVAYTFLYWLPYYISSTKVGGRSLSAAEAGNLSILFDVGGVLGGIVAGFLSDASSSPAVVSCSFVYLAIPVLYLYRKYGELSFLVNIGLMMVAGFFVNGPYALITTAVSADLGSSESVKGNEKALATVTAIIDGMGSIGAAIGPMATGYISELPGGFDNVFTMLYIAALSAGLLLSGLFIKEMGVLLGFGKNKKRGNIRAEDMLNSNTFSYLPPGESDNIMSIDNERGLVWGKAKE